MDGLNKLRLAARAAQDARDIYTIKVETRNVLIVAALDDGYEQKRVAEVAELAAPTIMAIAARFDNQRERSRPLE